MAADTHALRATHEPEKRARLTLDIAPELHVRLKVLAAQQHLSMRELVENLLLLTLPDLEHLAAGARLDLSQFPTVSRESLDQLRRTRQAIMRGRRFDDTSEDLLHEARSERDAAGDDAGERTGW